MKKSESWKGFYRVCRPYVATEQASTEKTQAAAWLPHPLDPFEAHADLIPQWLESEADVGNQELLVRLIDKGRITLNPERHGTQHIGTVQRRIRELREARVQKCLNSVAGGNQTRDG